MQIAKFPLNRHLTHHFVKGERKARSCILYDTAEIRFFDVTVTGQWSSPSGRLSCSLID